MKVNTNLLTRKKRQSLNAENFQQSFLRHVLGNQTWCFIPVTIFFHSEHMIVLRISCDTKWLAACDQDGHRIRIGDAAIWSLQICHWHTHDLTYLVPIKSWMAFGLIRKPRSTHINQIYINFQKPITPRSWGYDTLDLELDLVGDYQFNKELKWRWKDNDLYHELVKCGLISQNIDRKIQKAKGISLQQYEKFKDVLEEWALIEIQPPILENLLDKYKLPKDINNMVTKKQ